MGNPDSSSSPPPQTPPEQAPPPQQNWQSQPQQPAAPPAGGGTSSTMPPGPVAGSTIADFVTRAVAFVIDGVIIWLINVVISLVLTPLLLVALGGIFVLIQALAIVAVSVGYFVYFWTTRKQTPGMMVMKLMVVQDGTGAALSQDQAIRRWIYLGLPLALSALLSAGGGLGFFGGFGGLAILFTLATLVSIGSVVWLIYLAYTTYQDPRKQGVHDKAVNSLVVSVGPSPLGGMRT